MNAPNALPLTVADTNLDEQFVNHLHALPPDGEKFLTCVKRKNAEGKEGYVPMDALPPNSAIYGNVGSFIKSRAEDGYLSASKNNIEHCLALMLDDIGTKSKAPPVPPTWIMETSEGNYQWGYIFSERPTKADFSTAIKAISAAGYTDPGADNPVRWFRLPGSVNIKKNAVSKLVEFHPERIYTLPELCARMGVVPAPAVPTIRRARIEDDGGDDVLAWLSANGMVLSPRPSSDGWYEVRCPAAHEHSDDREGAGYHPADRAFKCMHSHGDQWRSNDFLAWVEDEGGPARRHGPRMELLFKEQSGAKDAPQSESKPSDDQLNNSQLFMEQVFERNGLDADNYRKVATAVPHEKGAFFIRMGDEYAVEYQADKGRVRGVGSPCPAFFGKFTEGVVYATDDWFSAAALHEATGVSVICVDRWAFGEIVTEEGESVRSLHTALLNIAKPNLQVRVVMPPDTDDDRAKRMATFRMLLIDEGVTVPAFTLPKGAPTFGAWANGKYGSRSGWPKGDALTVTMFKGGKSTPPALTRLPDEELSEAARSYTMSDPERFGKYHLDLTDRGAGSYILSKLGRGSFYFLKDRGDWVQWTGGGWRSIGSEPLKLVNVAAHGYKTRAEVLYVKADRLKAANGGKDDEAAKKTRAEARAFDAAAAKMSSTDGRAKVLRDLKSREEVAVYSSVFDSNIWLLNTASGVLNLKTGELRDATKEDMMLRQTPVRYVRGARHPKMEKLLSEITATHYAPWQGDGPRPDWMGSGYSGGDERLKYLQRRLGIALIGTNVTTSLEILYGEGANGKSVLAKAITHALGDISDNGYCVTVAASTFMSAYHSRDADAPTPSIASTPGARLLFMSESKEGDRLNEQLIKAATGGDKMAARGMYKEKFTFVPAFTPILLTNPLPEITEGGKALWDRLAPFHFKMRWRRPQANDPADKGWPDENLWYRDGMPHDAGALEFMLSWLVDGCLDYQKQGLGAIPADVCDAIAGYKVAANDYAIWLEERHWEFAPDAFVFVGDLYACFRDWGAANGKQIPATNLFVKRLLARCPTLKAEKRFKQRAIVGLRRRSGGTVSEFSDFVIP